MSTSDERVALDPALIGRLAAEFLAALPGAPSSVPAGPSPAVLPVPAPAAPSAPVSESLNPPYPKEFSFLEDARPIPPDSALSPSALNPFTTPPSPFVPAQAELEEILRGLQEPAAESATAGAPTGAEASPTGSSFGFLDDVRPRFPYPEEPPAAANPFAAAFDGVVPVEADLGQIPLVLEPAGGNSQATFGPPAPALPGGLGPAESVAPSGFSFLEDARPILSFPPQPAGPVPASESRKSPDLLPGSGIPTLSSTSYDAEAIRRDFPVLREVVNGRPLVWLDNGATTQKPQSVIDRLSYFYEHENSNVHRAAHELAARATDAYESAREKVRHFLNASSTREIVFVRGTTEAINLVAQSWGRQNIRQGDEIVITWLEHHANIVPWQMLCEEKGARLRVAPVDDRGQVILEEYEKLLCPRTRLVSVSQVSNALGTVTPVAEMVQSAHRWGARALVDGAQAVSHMRVDVQALDCDFYVLSGHKMFAPTGIGVVYGKNEVLDKTQPWQGGGNMIADVTFERTIYQGPPQRFEAGTGNIADAVGLGAAIDYLDRVGMPNVTRHEVGLLAYGTDRLLQVPGLRIIGTAPEKAGVLSFVIDGLKTEEIGDYLNRQGIAVRAGHHCAQPILRRFGLESTVRASLALYNTREDLDALADALLKLRGAAR
jgi:cysteine desulfurase / selenocysteine lyase